MPDADATWTPAHSAQAVAEGWDIFTDAGSQVIQKDDERTAL